MLRLLIIEAEDTQAEIFQLALDEHFEIKRAHDFASAKLLIKDCDIVISDWQINQQTAACLASKVKKHQHDKFPVLIVVSQDNRESSMIAAYNNGATFYITRPYKVIQFTECVLAVKSQIETLAQIRHDREQTALSTQTALGQCTLYGMGMDLTASLIKAKDEATLAKKLLGGLRLNGIHAAIEMTYQDTRTIYDSDDKQGDENLEEVFSVLRGQGRCYRFGQRCILTEGDMSLLLKHVVHTEDDLYETTLDVCYKVLMVAQSHYVNLRERHVLEHTQHEIARLIEGSQQQVRSRTVTYEEDTDGRDQDTATAPGRARLLDMERF